MNFTLLSCLMTVLSLLVFVGILVWAFRASNRARFEECGRQLMNADSEMGE